MYTLNFFDDLGNMFSVVGDVFGSIISIVISMVNIAVDGFVNVLRFIKLFFFDFFTDYMFSFETLPDFVYFGITAVFSFFIVLFILKLLKNIPFF